MTKENQMDDLMQIAIEAGLIGKEPNGFDRVTLTKAEVRFAQLVAKKAVEAAKAEERVEYQRLMEKHNNLHMNAHATRQRVAELEEVAKMALEALERVEERETFFSYSYEIDRLHAALR